MIFIIQPCGISLKIKVTDRFSQRQWQNHIRLDAHTCAVLSSNLSTVFAQACALASKSNGKTGRAHPNIVFVPHWPMAAVWIGREDEKRCSNGTIYVARKRAAANIAPRGVKGIDRLRLRTKLQHRLNTNLLNIFCGVWGTRLRCDLVHNDVKSIHWTNEPADRWIDAPKGKGCPKGFTLTKDRTQLNAVHNHHGAILYIY